MTTLMKPFNFEKPTSWEQFTQLIIVLKNNNQQFTFGAGNTDLLPRFKKGLNIPDCLISLTAIPELEGISIIKEPLSAQPKYLRIGASTRLSNIYTDKIINQYFPELARVAGLVANPQIRNQATLGGNLLVDNRCIYINQSENNRSYHYPCFKSGGDTCHLVKSAKVGDETLCQARFVSDTAPILILLDSRLEIKGLDGSRKISIRNFYKKDGIESHILQPDEVLVAIEIPLQHSKKIHYEKLAIRQTLDFASVGVAVAIKPVLNHKSKAAKDKETRNFEIEVAITGIQTLPGYEKYLTKNFESIDALLDRACQQANQFSLIYQQDFFPRAYRKKMIAVFIKRCFKRLRGTE